MSTWNSKESSFKQIQTYIFWLKIVFIMKCLIFIRKSKLTKPFVHLTIVKKKKKQLRCDMFCSICRFTVSSRGRHSAALGCFFRWSHDPAACGLRYPQSPWTHWMLALDLGWFNVSPRWRGGDFFFFCGRLLLRGFCAWSCGQSKRRGRMWILDSTVQTLWRVSNLLLFHI